MSLPAAFRGSQALELLTYGSFELCDVPVALFLLPRNQLGKGLGRVFQA